MKNRISTAGTLLALLLLTPFSLLAQTVRIAHIPVKVATAGQEITIEARLEGGALPQSAILFYRTPDQTGYMVAEMEIDQAKLNGAISGGDVTERGVEYYLEVTLLDGSKVTYPSGAPATSVFRINVSPVSTGGGQNFGDASILILSPAPGAKMSEGDVLIAVTLQQEKRKMPPDQLVLEVNGKDVTKQANVMPELVTYSIKNMKAGSYIITLSLKVGKDKLTLANWGFVIESDKLAKAAERKLPVRGNASVRYSHENISAKTRDVTTGTAQVSGDIGKLNWMTQVSATSLESSRLQPQNRYTGALKYKRLSLKVGDTSPRLSQFSAWGVRNRGVEFNYKGYAFNLDVAQGQMARSIQGEMITDTVYVTDATGDTLRSSDGLRDSTRVDTTAIGGAFTRNMLAVRPGLVLSDNATFSFNFLKVKDDVASISRGINPKDNLVIGGDLEIRSSNRRFVFNTEAAVSLYNSNINEPAMEAAKPLESLIIVNQYFEPLPTDSAILSDTIQKVDLAKKVLKELIASSMAAQVSLTLNFYHNELKLGYKTVGRSFKSLGSPSVQTDIRGFSLVDRIRLFTNRVYLNLGYESFEDNVNDRKPSAETLTKNTITGGLSYYTPPAYPNLNFSTRIYNRKNDSKYLYVTLPDGTPDSTGNPVSDQTASFDVSADQEFKLGGFDHNAVISYSSSIGKDDFNAAAANEMTTMTLQLSSRRDERLETGLSFGSTAQQSMNKLNKVDYTMLSGTSQYQLVMGLLWVNGGISLTSASGGLSPVLEDASQAYAGYALDFSRMEFSFGSTVKLGKSHEFNLSGYKVNHSDDGYTETWTPVDPDTNERTHAKMLNKDSATAVNQDDSAVRLRYSYKF